MIIKFVKDKTVGSVIATSFNVKYFNWVFPDFRVVSSFIVCQVFRASCVVNKILAVIYLLSKSDCYSLHYFFFYTVSCQLDLLIYRHWFSEYLDYAFFFQIRRNPWRATRQVRQVPLKADFTRRYFSREANFLVSHKLLISNKTEFF